MNASRLRFEPLTEERFVDLETLFAAKGCSVARWCWCTYYRTSGKRTPPRAGETESDRNRRELLAAVRAGEFVGLIAYRSGVPVGWLSFGPRDGYRKLARSPVMKPVDDAPVWSVICFVVPAEQRGQGIARALLAAAAAHAARCGARLLEAYPVDKPGRGADENLWFGPKSMFDACGFEEVARRKPTRPVVRLVLQP